MSFYDKNVIKTFIIDEIRIALKYGMFHNGREPLLDDEINGLLYSFNNDINELSMVLEGTYTDENHVIDILARRLYDTNFINPIGLYIVSRLYN